MKLAIFRARNRFSTHFQKWMEKKVTSKLLLLAAPGWDGSSGLFGADETVVSLHLSLKLLPKPPSASALITVCCTVPSNWCRSASFPLLQKAPPLMSCLLPRRTWSMLNYTQTSIVLKSRFRVWVGYFVRSSSDRSFQSWKSTLTCVWIQITREILSLEHVWLSYVWQHLYITIVEIIDSLQVYIVAMMMIRQVVGIWRLSWDFGRRLLCFSMKGRSPFCQSSDGGGVRSGRELSWCPLRNFLFLWMNESNGVNRRKTCSLGFHRWPTLLESLLQKDGVNCTLKWRMHPQLLTQDLARLNI